MADVDSAVNVDSAADVVNAANVRWSGFRVEVRRDVTVVKLLCLEGWAGRNGRGGRVSQGCFGRGTQDTLKIYTHALRLRL